MNIGNYLGLHILLTPGYVKLHDLLLVDENGTEINRPGPRRYEPGPMNPDLMGPSSQTQGRATPNYDYDSEYGNPTYSIFELLASIFSFVLRHLQGSCIHLRLGLDGDAESHLLDQQLLGLPGNQHEPWSKLFIRLLCRGYMGSSFKGCYALYKEF